MARFARHIQCLRTGKDRPKKRRRVSNLKDSQSDWKSALLRSRLRVRIDCAPPASLDILGFSESFDEFGASGAIIDATRRLQNCNSRIPPASLTDFSLLLWESVHEGAQRGRGRAPHGSDLTCGPFRRTPSWRIVRCL